MWEEVLCYANFVGYHNDMVSEGNYEEGHGFSLSVLNVVSTDLIWSKLNLDTLWRRGWN